MDGIKYVDSKCCCESEGGGSCPNCQVPLVVTCTACGNPIVGVQINPSDWGCHGFIIGGKQW